MSIDEYLQGLGFIKKQGEYQCEHITVSDTEFSIVFDLKALIANYEGAKNLLQKDINTN